MKKNLSLIWNDIKLLYKNFMLWFRVKLISRILWIILGIFLIIPICFLALFYAWNKDISFQNLNFFDPSFSSDLILNIFYILIFVFFIIWFLYQYFIITKFNLELQEKWKKIEFKTSKIFFNFKNFYTFLKILLFYASFSIFFILFFILFFAALQFFFGSENSINIVEKSYLNIFFISFWFFIIFAFYSFYRFAFIPAFMIDEKIWLKKSIKKSFEKTSWWKKTSKIFLVTMISLIAYSPLSLLKQKIEFEKNESSNYLTLSILEKNQELQEKEKIYLTHLKNKFSYENIDEINILKNVFSALSTILWATYFILFFGIWNSIYTSIYRNLIK